MWGKSPAASLNAHTAAIFSPVLRVDRPIPSRTASWPCPARSSLAACHHDHPQNGMAHKRFLFVGSAKERGHHTLEAMPPVTSVPLEPPRAPSMDGRLSGDISGTQAPSAPKTPSVSPASSSHLGGGRWWRDGGGAERTTGIRRRVPRMKTRKYF